MKYFTATLLLVAFLGVIVSCSHSEKVTMLALVNSVPFELNNGVILSESDNALIQEAAEIELKARQVVFDSISPAIVQKLEGAHVVWTGFVSDVRDGGAQTKVGGEVLLVLREGSWFVHTHTLKVQ